MPWRYQAPGGGYSLCDGWYICAVVLTPFFHFGRIEHDLFGVLFLIHQQQSYLLGYKNYQFLQKSIFLAPNSIFSSIFLGPIFSGQRHTPIRFQAEYPPRDQAPRHLCAWFRKKNIAKPCMIFRPKTWVILSCVTDTWYSAFRTVHWMHSSNYTPQLQTPINSLTPGEAI